MFKVKSSHSYSDLLEGILIGASLGAATTFIFGTKKGKQFQKELLQHYKKLGRTTTSLKHKLDKTLPSPAAKKAKRKIKAKARKVTRKVKTKLRVVKHHISHHKAA